uniref:SNF2_N domain-containing protein n=1 Tax=Macrostomum lignano TaxID=282301 RepID=A0A1I8H320_9PLAT
VQRAGPSAFYSEDNRPDWPSQVPVCNLSNQLLCYQLSNGQGRRRSQGGSRSGQPRPQPAQWSPEGRLRGRPGRAGARALHRLLVAQLLRLLHWRQELLLQVCQRPVGPVHRPVLGLHLRYGCLLQHLVHHAVHQGLQDLHQRVQGDVGDLLGLLRGRQVQGPRLLLQQDQGGAGQISCMPPQGFGKTNLLWLNSVLLIVITNNLI